ncbi:UDP-N-acetylglucosamine--N-acetylmuramyl-(pentapeptide) pyrophosphoryl-undecaprenol N-acetylglucosamine transferase [Agrococcus sp. ARC_14]|uniref:UDP-N-acetylglucosamine--N-acetylmuramyl- (pentapeptide) pyrophosphoryl-undecaprenol N-acetylglucosamine transferase n=1 Tax=Agrococcus sp. ARC_14 TaxID=2919927 RepID=UPI001F067086|nr:UDP-N-acetylglucosamine--N-acetylmuramyl-(pentapeptide) pyrophosphoryl-undecaprenol N-acetylglucosamine transferase [Agrococcus sp. ARC_14]MCH1883471.1 UDP-N-acetylglucosamine--N-acetylmuramyl-(pentapeptide) pyrophosphoryl-undecaprenol N-acetylglucosamine transferase [Agrococcus sp. ARC_14]
MRVLLAGGGTAGHVNPLLATARRLRERMPEAELTVLGTAEGLERELVPRAGLELVTIEKLPFPRRPDAAALRFPGRWRRAVREVRALIRDRGIDVVVGFGGYASAPAYRAAHLERVPIVIHESNAKPGMANVLGARWTEFVGLSYRATTLKGEVVGMPLRPEITGLDRAGLRAEAVAALGLDPERPTLLVTGGSQGARSINRTIVASADAIVAAGWQILHLSGGRQTDFEPASSAHYVAIEYLDRMHLALAAADLVVCRAGSLTVSELMAVGLPAVYVPLPYGNGEQGMNAADQVSAGGALLVADGEFTAEWVRTRLVPLLRDADRLAEMASASAGAGASDGSDRMCALIERAAATRRQS